MDSKTPYRLVHPRIGAVRDLGIEVEWRYCFVGAGEMATSQHDVVYLDVGGSIEPGILDHHEHEGTESIGSTARILFDRPHLVHDHLMGRWKERVDEEEFRGRRWSPVIVVHTAPDFDAMVSAALARRLVEDGGLHPVVGAIVDIADDIDQGEFELGRESGDSIVGILAGLQHATTAVLDEIDGGRDDDPDERRMRIGVAIVDAWLRIAVRDSASVNESGRSRLALDSNDPELRGLKVAVLKSYYAHSLEDFIAMAERHEAVFHRFQLRVPRASPPTSRDTMEIQGVALSSKFFTASPLSMYFARSGVCENIFGRPDLVFEERVFGADGGAESAKRFVISLRPSIRATDGLIRRPTLRGLGLKLERLEQERRRSMGHAAESERRGQTRFSEFPGIRDPWYDGRGHGHSIVDSPRHGSVLDFEKIVDVLQTAFWEPDLDSVEIVDLSDEAAPRDVEVDLAEIDRDGFRDVNRLVSEIDYRVLQMRVHPAWDLRSIDEEITRFVGGRVESGEFDGLAYVFGRRGMVCIVPQDPAIPDVGELVEIVRPARRMQRAIERVSLELSRRDGSRERCDVSSLIDDFVRSTSEFRHESRPFGDSRTGVCRGVIAGLGLEVQIERIDRLLEHFDDRFEREASGRLNLVLVLLGLLGLFEVASAVLEHFEADENPMHDWADVMWWMILLLIAVVVGLGFGASRSDRFARWQMRLFGIRR